MKYVWLETEMRPPKVSLMDNYRGLVDFCTTPARIRPTDPLQIKSLRQLAMLDLLAIQPHARTWFQFNPEHPAHNHKYEVFLSTS